MSNDYEQATAAPGEVRKAPSKKEPDEARCPVCGCRVKLVDPDA